MNLNQVTLPARDISTSAVFCRRMGFTQIVDSPQYARFEYPAGDGTFSLHTVDQPVADIGVTVYFEEHALEGHGLEKHDLEKHDLEKHDLGSLIARMQAHGFEFVEASTDTPYLWREARLADPTGNLICLYRAGENRKNPPWRVESRASPPG
jgi:catechol 2,3-dioxygenase-like lactoylglutathione lyase family enzyme